MARSKSKPEIKITQLELFPEERLVEIRQDKKKSKTGKTEQQAEAAPPKKQTRKKKSSDQTTDPEAPSPEQFAEPVQSITPVLVEEAPASPPADLKQTKENTRLKENYKKIQEERLAALKKVREKK